MQTVTAPSRPLRLLLLEDQAADAELCERELKRAGLVFDTRCVATRSAFEAALDQFAPDLIISDFSLPNAFNGLAALEISRQKLPHVPFVFVSGTIGEERAVEAMRRGATDYVLKDRLNRLVPVVKRILDEVHERAARQRAEAEVRKQEQRIARLSRFRSVLSSINSAIVRVRDRDQLLRDACRTAVEEGQFLLAWVGVPDHASLEIKPSVWHGRNGTFLEKLNSSLREDLPAGQDTTALAARSRRTVIVNDIAGDSSVSNKAAALEQGFRALAASPLLIGDQVFGVLNLYAGESGAFDQEEVKLLEELTGNISFALDHLHKAAQLDYLAYFDSLTGLPNRLLFYDRITQFIGRHSGGPSGVAVILLDLYRFRSINESLGIAVGDALLKQVAARLTAAAGEPITMARLNADCFAVAVADPRREAGVAHTVQDHLLAVFEEPFVIAGQEELRIRASAGIALHPDDGDNAADLCISAEAALRSAKQTGERFLFYTRKMNARAAEKLRLESRVRTALREEQFVLHYQPRLTLATGRISGVEALLRWSCPERGLIPPGEFIPLLEETGMILEVGQWALTRAATDHAAWRAQGLNPPRIAVNVSAAQMRQRDFVASLMAAAALSGGAGWLDIELTESILMDDVESYIRKLSEIRAAGIGIAIDDFGTGYSSLSYLVRLPLDMLKIDRSFVSLTTSSPQHMAIVSTIISLARSLNLKVTAEGVETDAQRNLLRLLKCDEMQGFLFSKPLPARELIELLQPAEVTTSAGIKPE